MKKIKQMFNNKGFKVEFQGTYSRKQYRSEHTCLEDYYKITKDNEEYQLIVKITGKKLFLMDKKKENGRMLVAGGESEKSFIEYFEGYLKQLKA